MVSRYKKRHEGPILQENQNSLSIIMDMAYYVIIPESGSKNLFNNNNPRVFFFLISGI
jgi:hypothetical protein